MCNKRPSGAAARRCARLPRCLSFLLLLAGLTACNKANVGPLFDAGASGAASCGFATTVLRVSVSQDNDGIIRIPIYRNGSGQQVCKLDFHYDPTATGSAPDEEWTETDPDGVFSLSSRNVVFPRDAVSAYAVISFSSLDKILPGRKYIMRLDVVGGEGSLQQTRLTLTVSRRLQYVKYADCTFRDECLFDGTYDCELWKATEAQVYRVMDPYSRGLQEEGYVEEGLSRNPPEYLEFRVDEAGNIAYEPFYTGMLVPTTTGARVGAYGFYPGEYIWGKDFSSYNAMNRRTSDKEFVLYPVYCLPDFAHGFLNEGVYKLTVTVKDE